MARLRGSTWQGDVTVEVDGKARRSRKDGFSTEAEAELWEAQAKIALALGKDVAPLASVIQGRPAGITLGELVKYTEKGLWKEKGGAEKARINAAFAVDYFGKNKQAAEITRGDIVKYATHLRETTANADSTINRKLAALSRALTYGMECELTPIGWRPPSLKGIRQKEGEGRLRYLREETSEEALVLQTFRQWSMPWAVDFTIFLVDTGARWASEGLTLTEPRVNFKDELVIFVGELTKNGRTRAVPMTSRVKEVLMRRRGQPTFFNDISESRYRHAWDRMQTHMGLGEDPEFVPHCLRHTCATRLVQSGVEIAVVQKWLGHRTIQQTMRYAHLAPKQLLTGRDALERFSAPEVPALVAIK